MRAHRLRREIIATQVVNNMLHGGGTTFVFRLHEETGAPASDIARAYAVAREVFGMRAQWGEIEALDNKVEAETQTQMLLEGRRLVERGTRWLLRNRRRPLDIAATVRATSRPVRPTLYESLPRLLGPSDVEPLASQAARAGAAPACRASLAERVAGPGDDVLGARHRRGGRRDRPRRRTGGRRALPARRAGSSCTGCATGSSSLPRDDRWGALARAALRDDLYSLHRALTAEVLRQARPTATSDAVDVDRRQPGGRALPADARRHPRRVTCST